MTSPAAGAQSAPGSTTSARCGGMRRARVSSGSAGASASASKTAAPPVAPSAAPLRRDAFAARAAKSRNVDAPGLTPPGRMNSARWPAKPLTSSSVAPHVWRNQSTTTRWPSPQKRPVQHVRSLPPRGPWPCTCS